METDVLITLLFLMPLFYYTPIIILAAIIITIVIGLIDYEAAFKQWKVDKLDFLACVCSFFGVLFISVPLGRVIAVGVSVFKILLHVTRTNTGVLGNIPRTHVYQNLSRYRTTVQIPSFLVLDEEAPIYFANSTYLQERSGFFNYDNKYTGATENSSTQQKQDKELAKDGFSVNHARFFSGFWPRYF